jgi:hypothetical protein
MDPRRSPQWILRAHLSDEPPDLAVDLRASTAPARLPKPIGSKPARCQRITVSGLTITRHLEPDGNSRYSYPNIRRSMLWSRTRVRDVRLKTITCWRRTMFSASSLARDLNRERTRSRSQVRNATIASSSSTPVGPRHSGQGFRSPQRSPGIDRTPHWVSPSLSLPSLSSIFPSARRHHRRSGAALGSGVSAPPMQHINGGRAISHNTAGKNFFRWKPKRLQRVQCGGRCTIV